MTTIHLFIGEMGSGKSFHAKRFAEQIKAPFLEGDDAVPPEMAKTINLITPPPERVIESFVRNELLQAIVKFAQKHRWHPNVVVSQALYRNKHRAILTSGLAKHGLEVKFHWVRCPVIQHAKQLLSRPKGLGWLWFCLVNKLFFEKPIQPHETQWNIGSY